MAEWLLALVHCCGILHGGLYLYGLSPLTWMAERVECTETEFVPCKFERLVAGRL